MKLCGLQVESSEKPYCNAIRDGIPYCCDTASFSGGVIRYFRQRILIGDEQWYYDESSKCYCFIAEDKYYDEIDNGLKDPMLCTHFRWTTDVSIISNGCFSGGQINEIKFNYDNGACGVDTFRCWLNENYKKGRPVEVLYIMRIPQYEELKWSSRERDITFSNLQKYIG